MPIININLPGFYDKQSKDQLFNACAETVHQFTGTSKELIYVFLNEYDPENCRKSAPVVNIDWTENINSRGIEEKKQVMHALTDYLHQMTQCRKDEIVIIINDLPPTNTCLGGFSRAEKA